MPKSTAKGSIQRTSGATANPIVAYSVKTNGNLSICRLMAEHGSGFDVTSGGELHRALTAGSKGSRIVFAGVGKTDAEMRYGLENGVFLFNVESEGELHALGAVAQAMGVKAPVALRVNPDLPPKTHAKTDTSVKGVKFGLDIETVIDVTKSVVGHPGLAVVVSFPWRVDRPATSDPAAAARDGHDAPASARPWRVNSPDAPSTTLTRTMTGY